METFAHLRSLPKRVSIYALSRALGFFNFQLVKSVNYEEEQRVNGMIMPMYAHTMIGLKRLDNIQFCVEKVIQDNIGGDLIEAGVWRGGASIFMRAILATYGITDRRVFVADSFRGLPEPDESKYPQDKGDRHYKFRFVSCSKEEVEANFEKYGLLDEQVVFLQGWFKDTLPNVPISELAIISVDADMYGSTMDALSHLYPKLSKGGFCIVDDYALPNCKHAVDDFLAKWNINSPVEKIDWTGIFWRKE